MQLRRLDHVSLRITDLGRARAFYEELLGLRPVPRPDLGFPGAWYDVAGTQLHLIQRDGAPAAPDGIDPAGPHFALQVASLTPVKAELAARGIDFLAFGDTQLWLRDPDGNVIELCEATRAR